MHIFFERIDNMIPKIIHYCWFGGNPKPESVKKYIESWRKYCPDYEIKEWNESNFNLNENDYCKEAYEAKKWAFVTDYVRLKALYEYGGIYMDTDVEVVKNFDDLLTYNSFMCFESPIAVSIGTFGSVKKLKLIEYLLNKYKGRHFQWRDDNQMITNLDIVTQVLQKKYNLKLNGMMQVLSDNIVIFPMEYFIAKSNLTGWIVKNEETYAIHHYAASWFDDSLRQKSLRHQYYARYYMKKFEKLASKLASIHVIYEINGSAGVMKRILSKITHTSL